MEKRKVNEPLPIKIVSKALTYQKIEGLFIKLNKHWNEKSLGYEKICRGALLEILYDIIRSFETKFSSRAKIETLLAYINTNLDKKITVDTLASIVNLSADYLAAQFKSTIGFTLIQSINRCRIDNTKVVLLNEELRIKDIAAKVGFCAEFYFYKTFKSMKA